MSVLPTRSRPGLRSAARALLATALGALLLAPVAGAETIKVTAGESIQEAIDAAAAGDVLVIAGGIYKGRLDIPVGKDGLQLTGKGKVIVDAAESVTEGVSAGITIRSSGVVLKNLTVRHAPDEGIVTSGIGLTGVILDKVTVLNCGATSISLSGDSITVNRCTVRGGDGAGISVTGDSVSLTKNTVQQCTGDALSVMGDDALISRNTLSDVGDNGIDILGDNALAERNTISRTDDSAITLTGNAASIDKNTIQSVCNDAGILVTGAAATISRNKLSAVLNGQAAVRLIVFGVGGSVDRNTIRDCHGPAVHATGDGLAITGNKVTDCGIVSNGLEIDGNTNTISGNVVKGAHEDGIRVTGNGNLIATNKVTDGLEDGIVVGSGSSNTLDGNSVRSNQSEGVENGGMGTVLRNNKISKNRIDVVNDSGSGATIIIEDNNSIGDGSDGTADPEV